VLRRAGRVADAAEVLKQAAALQPNDTELLCELAELWCDIGRWHDALVTAQAAIQRTPGIARAHAAAGMALLGADQCSLAADSLERALNLDATLGYAAVNWGEALLRLERPQQAAYAYRNAVGASSVRVEAHLGLGRSLALLGDIAGAAQSFRSAYEVRPEDVANALTVASKLEEVGQPEMASAILSDATTRAPGDASLHYALGALFHRRVRLAEAVGSYDRALRIAPDHVQAILDRGHALESLGRLADAVAAFKAVQPQSAESVAGLVSCAFRRCDWDQVESGMELLEHFSAGLDILHPFLLLAAGVSPTKQLTILERRAARLTAQWPVADAPPSVRSHPPLKVAYLSPDFREHAVAHAIVRVIESHDRNRVQPIGVCLAAADRSEVGARLRSAFDLTIDVSEASDREIVARLRELEVDIAVDLAGFTVGARTPIFAARCAPIQVNYLGFPATMGAQFMDYIIADEVVIPKDAEASYAERVVRVPHCYLPLDCTRAAAASPDRAEAGLPAQAIVFCGFNNSYKIARGVFRVWMSLLCEIPGSVLWLRNMGTEAMENLRRAAEQLGVAPSRLVFASHVDRVDEYLARLQLADVFLDTLPYNAHTTAADALWAGVPVVTCRGNTFAGRVGASLLTAAGLPDLVCDNLDDYRSKALRLAIRPDELRDARERLAHARRRPAPVFDMQLYTQGLEDLYLSMRAHPTGRSNHLA
jgi:protein O-GlcNAc transferase